MANGIEIYDSAGRTLMSITDRLPRVHSSYSVTAGSPFAGYSGFSGFVAVPGMARNGLWLVVPGIMYNSFTNPPNYSVAPGQPNIWCTTGGFNWSCESMDLFIFTFSATVYMI